MAQKLVSHEELWSMVVDELKAEKIKLASYDNTLVQKLGPIQGKKILDYGCGPGVLALALQKVGANVQGFDISEQMADAAAQRIGKKNVYQRFENVPKNAYDYAICNLVLCIVEETEVVRIAMNIKECLKKNGEAYLGFCNPKIYDIEESQLDIRIPTGHAYRDNHEYRKVKKEGDYKIVEKHRPIEWYKRIFQSVGFKTADIFFTPEYELKGNKIQDFVIFKLTK